MALLKSPFKNPFIVAEINKSVTLVVCKIVVFSDVDDIY
jgi:hypothetical protein